MYYPEITNPLDLLPALKLIKRKVDEDSQYLLNSDCPYPSDLAYYLSNMMVEANQEVSSGDEIDVEREAITLFNDMKTFKKDLTHADTSERASMFRTLTSLMEKIINVKERASALHNFQAFESIIFETIDGYLDPQQRTELFDRLKELSN